MPLMVIRMWSNCQRWGLTVISIDMGGRVCVVGKVSDNLAKGADVATTDGARRSVLHVAAVGEEDDVVKILLAKGADMAATDGIRWTVQYDGGHEKFVKIRRKGTWRRVMWLVDSTVHCSLE